MDVLKLIILVIALMAFVVAALAIKILLKKGGEFPNTHIGGNKYLKSKGISCAQTEDKIEQAKARKELRFKQLFLDESDTIGSC